MAVANGAASFRVTATSARAWSTAVGAISLEVLVAVRNAGDAPLELDASKSSYVVRDAAGVAASKGRFGIALPPKIAPNATGYLVATDTVARASSRLEVEPHVAASPSPPAADKLEIRVGRPTFSSGRVSVPATVVNRSDTTATNVVIGAVLLDARDRPLAAFYEFAGPGTLRPHATAKVAIDDPPPGPVTPGRVARVAASVFALDR